MKNRHDAPHSWLLKAAAVIQIVVLLSVIGCSPDHGDHHREMTLKQKINGNQDQLSPDSWSDFKKIFDLYAVNGKLTGAQLNEIFEKFTPQFAEFIKKILETHPKADFTFAEFSKTLEDSCTTLTWVKTGSIDDAKSRAITLKKIYPAAHEPIAAAFQKLLDDLLPKDRKAKPDELIRLGVLFAEAKHKVWPEPMASALKKLENKELWRSAPDVAVFDYNETDRQLNSMSIVLKFLRAKRGPPEAVASDEFRESPEGKKMAKLRERHRQFFAELGQFSATPLDADDDRTIEIVERMDWHLNRHISDHIVAGAGTSGGAASTSSLASAGVNSHLQMVNPKLLANWDPAHPFFENSKADTVLTDLLTASTADDVIEFCQLTPPPTMSREAVSVFLYRLSTMTFSPGASSTPAQNVETAAADAISSASGLPCERVNSALHPDSATYAIWRIRAFFASKNN